MYAYRMPIAPQLDLNEQIEAELTGSGKKDEAPAATVQVSISSGHDLN
jgi:hypothetical protein